MLKTLLTSAALAVTLFISTPSYAQTTGCYNREQVIENVTQQQYPGTYLGVESSDAEAITELYFVLKHALFLCALRFFCSSVPW